MHTKLLSDLTMSRDYGGVWVHLGARAVYFLEKAQKALFDNM